MSAERQPSVWRILHLRDMSTVAPKNSELTCRRYSRLQQYRRFQVSVPLGPSWTTVHSQHQRGNFIGVQVLRRSEMLIKVTVSNLCNRFRHFARGMLRLRDVLACHALVGFRLNVSNNFTRQRLHSISKALQAGLPGVDGKDFPLNRLRQYLLQLSPRSEG